ncbi:putative inactive purple acid phosphatase 27 [Morella rubra]|uniref:Purple acid phosphatase n=1 Tax=Morella rubra TaxID=262757 RepID=A0A6A1VWW2_9ROSI|nr:putative inactive purple acid phosphatase 27 [Morella rubra]
MEETLARCLNLFPIAVFLCLTCLNLAFADVTGSVDHPLSQIALHKTTFALRESVYIKAKPYVLGLQGEDTEWVTVNLANPNPSAEDWVAVFSPANFSSSTCSPVNYEDQSPYLCTSPIKFKYANSSSSNYTKTGKAVLKFQLINQRADFSFALFSGGLSNPKLVAISNFISFANPKAPLYPRLAQGKSWNEMTVTWTSGYALDEAVEWGLKGETQIQSPAGTLRIDQSSMCGTLKDGPFCRMVHTSGAKCWGRLMTVTWTSGYALDEAFPLVEWGLKGETQIQSPAGTLRIDQSSMCVQLKGFLMLWHNMFPSHSAGSPARTVGWRDQGFIHTSFLMSLWPNSVYTYKMGHRLSNGSYIWSKSYAFRSSPYPGQDSLQRVIIFGDMGKAERDGSNEYSDYQPGSLNTTDELIKDLENIDIVFHIGDLSYANGYVSQWDQFTSQVEPIASGVPYMVGSGNHERDWPDSGSFYKNMDSGGECGVFAETMFYVPAENRAKFWYATDYGMFHFCIADSEHDWREGTEQYRFIEQCLASADRQKQPWLIFAAHRVLGYSSNTWYAEEGSFEEPMGRESLQKLWQKYRVDIAFYGHVHNYERTCPIYENQCVNSAKSHYSGTTNGTIHVVVGGGGSHLSTFTTAIPDWSIYRDYDFGFVKLTAFNHSSLLFEYKKSRDGNVYDSFTISREYKDVLACVHDSCEATTLAS